MNPKSLQNLEKRKSFSKENQPNGRGRPKGSRNRKKIFDELLCIQFDDDTAQAEYLRKVFPNLPKNLSVYELLNMKLIEVALDGNIKAIQQINEKADGRPTQTQKIEMSEKVEPIEITSRVFTKELCGEALALSDKHPNLETRDLMDYVYMKNQLEISSDNEQNEQ